MVKGAIVSLGVTVKSTALLVPLAFITETGYTPGVTCWAAAVQLSAFGGQRSKLSGTTNLIIVPNILVDIARFLIYPLPNFTVLSLAVKPVPVMVTGENPTGPEVG